MSNTRFHPDRRFAKRPDFDTAKFYYRRPDWPPAPPKPEVPLTVDPTLNPEPETHREVKLYLVDPRPPKKLRAPRITHEFAYSINEGPAHRLSVKLPTTLRGRDAEKYLQENISEAATLISVTHDFPK